MTRMGHGRRGAHAGSYLLGMVFALAVSVTLGRSASAQTQRSITPPPSRDTVSFVLFGDASPRSAETTNIVRAAAEAASALSPDFVMLLGNKAGPTPSPERWQAAAESYLQALEPLDAPWYAVPAPGDTSAGDAYTQRFGPTGYGFDTGFVHVSVIQTDADDDGRGTLVQSQIDALANRLAASTAERVLVFMHHPLWLADTAAWPRLLRVLEADGRPIDVYAAGLRHTREDNREGHIGLHVVGPTGAIPDEDLRAASFQQIALVRVDRTGPASVALVDPRRVIPGDVIAGDELDALARLREVWLRVEGTLEVSREPGSAGVVRIELWNPTDRPISYTVSIDAPPGWMFTQSVMRGELDPETGAQFRVRADAPGLGERRPEIAVMARATYAYEPDATGTTVLEETIVTRALVPVQPGSVETAAADGDGVLALKGTAAVEVPIGALPEQFTLECWVRGMPPLGRTALVSARTPAGGFAIEWSTSDEPTGTPAAVVAGRDGPAVAHAAEPWDWSAWTHLAMTCDGEHVVLYRDGEPVGAADVPGGIKPAQGPLFIGAAPSVRSDARDYFDGDIDDVRLSEGVRYNGSFTPAHTLTSDAATLVLFSFNGPGGPVLRDDGPNSHHAWAVGYPIIERGER